MAQELSIQWKASGSNKSNAATRIFSPSAPGILTLNGQFRSVHELRRSNGMWADPGGSGHSLVITCYDHLIDASTGATIKTSVPATARCYSSGPSADNIAQTSFTNFTNDESRAVISAWSAGTLRITRTASVTSATSASHGQIVYRSGAYDDIISIRGYPFTYEPKLLMPALQLKDALYDASGSAAPFGLLLMTNVGSSSSWEGGTVCKKLELKVENLSGGSAPVSAIAAKTQNNTSAQSWILTEADFTFARINGGFKRGNRYRVTATFSVGPTATQLYESVTASREINSANIPLHLSRYGNGVGIGQYSSVKDADEKGVVDVAWPINANGGIRGVTNYAYGEVATGGTWVDGKPVYRYVGAVTTTNTGMITSLAALPSAVGTLISLNGVMVNGGGWFPLAALGVNANYYSYLFMATANSISAMIGTAFAGSKTIYYTVEYTKA